MQTPDPQRLVLPCGDHAVLVELDSLESVLAFAAAARDAVGTGRAGWDAVVDVVPAARTVLLASDETVSVAGRLRAAAEALVVEAATRTPESPAPEPVEIPVRYDGEDLAEVGRLTGLSGEEVVHAHTGRDWQAAFGGFAPGFIYLTGGDDRLRVPRRDEPRTSVPAGSVALAGEFSAVYPRSSPGGWQLIGHTDVVLFDVDRVPPALLQPGIRVRFRAR